MENILGVFYALIKGLFTLIKEILIAIFTGIKNIFTGKNKVKNIILLVGGTALLFGAKYFFINFLAAKLEAKGQGDFLAFIFLFAWIVYPFIFIGVHGEFVERLKLKKERQKYWDYFDTINFKSPTNKRPTYAGKRQQGNFEIKTFFSSSPLTDWLKKQEILEVFENRDIYEIRNRKNNKNIIEIVTVTTPLPKRIDFKKSLMLYGDKLVIGQGITGQVVMDLSSTPHTLVAGASGSGKSVALRSLLYQSLQKGYSAEIIDFKGGISFSMFDDYVQISTTHESAKNVLENLCNEAHDRQGMYYPFGVDKLELYNDKMKETGERKLERIILIIDELAELMDTTGTEKEDKKLIKECEGLLRTLVRTGRATGIHIFAGIQRPDAKLLDGQIKNNLSYRICGRFPDPQASNIVLDSPKASNLPLIEGRMIAGNANESYDEVQTYFLPNDKSLFNATEKPQTKKLEELETTGPIENTKRLFPFDITAEEMDKQAQQAMMDPDLLGFDPTEQANTSRVEPNLDFDFSDIEL